MKRKPAVIAYDISCDKRRRRVFRCLQSWSLDAQYSAKANIPFVRFADDFLLFANTEEQALQAMRYAKVQLDKLSLKLHPEKTKIIRSNPGVTFLGEKLPKSSR